MKKKETIFIDSEIMVEINNLCCQGESSKVNDLLKYITPQKVLDKSLDENSLWLAFSFFGGYPYPLKELPKDVVSFWWKQDGELNAVCYISNTDNANFIEAFKLDISEVGRIVFNKTGNGKINKEVHLNNVLSYSGNDYDLMFRLQGETIKCGRPPLIKHDYDLQLIDNLSPYSSVNQRVSDCHEKIEKYYDLYRLGNKKAKQALKASGFNLDAMDN